MNPGHDYPFEGYEPGVYYPFYGIDSNCFKLSIGVFEAEEDPADGYRSYLGIVKMLDEDNLVFFNAPIASVRAIPADEKTYNAAASANTCEDFDGWALVDDTNHIWLVFGTDRTHDYYPCFTFRYYPKESK